VLLGAYGVAPWIAIVGGTGIIWGAAYMLWMFQRVMFGPLEKPENKQLKDLNAREIAILVPIILAMFWIGLYSNSFLGKTDTAVKAALEHANPQVAVSAKK
jgi:NADH-quinone oxidoreductase subunit M